MKLVFFTFLLVIMSFTAKASNELCFSNAYSDAVSVSLASDTIGWAYDHPWSDNRGFTLKGYRFTPDLAQFLSVLESLDNNWETPTAPWQKNSIIVNVVENGAANCQIVYSRKELYAQSGPTGAFLVRSLYEFEAEEINNALFKETTPIR